MYNLLLPLYEVEREVGKVSTGLIGLPSVIPLGTSGNTKANPRCGERVFRTFIGSMVFLYVLCLRVYELP
jgi:hypothetical protein